MNRRRFNRKFPRPAPTPDGMVWATIRQQFGPSITKLMPIEAVEAIAKTRMGKYDLYPQERRDQMKRTFK